MIPLCIYHGNCADGFTAAWVVHKYFGGDVEFFAGSYSKPPPDVIRRNVIIVDFSYKRPVMLEIANAAGSVLVLDHHKTAADDLAVDNNRFWRTESWETFCAQAEDDHASEDANGIYTVFDMERSGAGITWDFFFQGKPRPRLVDHVEDRDLWRFKFPDTRAIQACVFSYPYDFKIWDSLVSRCENTRDRDIMIETGEAIERKHFKDIEELVEATGRTMRIGGYIVPVANLPYTMTSDAGHLMCQTSGTFACCYMDKPEGRYFSLQSDPKHASCVDVSEIAKKYGGGGHPNASGFTVPYDQLAQFEP